MLEKEKLTALRMRRQCQMCIRDRPCTRRFLHPEDEVLCRVGKRGYRRRLGEGEKNARLFRALCGHSRVPVG